MRSPVGPTDFGLYVHYPYCARICPYCDFNVRVGRAAPALLDAVLTELDARAREFDGPLRSIYFGGGTPSEWGAAPIARIVEAARARFGLVANAEITLEANPESFAEAAAFRAAGVTRLSLGAQSFDPRALRFLGRAHRAEQVEAAFRAARGAGLATSIDLIYALPGLGFEPVAEALERTVALGPDHVAAYTLTIEEGTNFGRRARAGKLAPCPDDAQVEESERLVERLNAAGYARYEVSAFARPGHVAIHNSLYWAGAPYLGLGPGAHSYRPGPRLTSARRWVGVRDPARYLEDPRALEGEEELGAIDAVGERIIVGLRTAWGVDLAALEAETGRALVGPLSPAIEGLVADGHLDWDGAVARPKAHAFMLADTLARPFVTALDRMR